MILVLLVPCEASWILAEGPFSSRVRPVVDFFFVLSRSCFAIASLVG